MQIYTYQIAKWREVKKLDITAIDTTVKSGIKQLAPKWDMVLNHKNGTLSNEDYTEQYREMLIASWFNDLEFWDDFLRQPLVALGCYCKAGAFCHRHLLVDFLKEIVEVEYMGEIGVT